MNPSQELAAIEEVIRNILAGMQDTIQSGEILTDEFQGQLAELLNAATQRITQLHEAIQLEEAEQEQKQVADNIPILEEPTQSPSVATGEPVPPLDQASHESSNINAFRYEPDKKKLYVKFQGKYPSQNGPVYSYEGVPANLFEVLKRGAVAPKTSGSNAWHTWKEGVTPSHGAAMYALIKQGGYPYQRLS